MNPPHAPLDQHTLYHSPGYCSGGYGDGMDGVSEMTENGRAWVAKMQWKGAAKPFWFGTVYARLGAPQHEVEQAVHDAVKDILPPDLPRPDIISLQPGMLVIMPEDEMARSRMSPTGYRLAQSPASISL